MTEQQLKREIENLKAENRRQIAQIKHLHSKIDDHDRKIQALDKIVRVAASRSTK